MNDVGDSRAPGQRRAEMAGMVVTFAVVITTWVGGQDQMSVADYNLSAEDCSARAEEIWNNLGAGQKNAAWDSIQVECMPEIGHQSNGESK